MNTESGHRAQEPFERGLFKRGLEASDLPPGPRSLASKMCDLARNGDFPGQLWHGNESLAAATGLNEKSVRRHRQTLARWGVIRIERRYERGKRTSDLITMQPPSDAVCAACGHVLPWSPPDRKAQCRSCQPRPKRKPRAVKDGPDPTLELVKRLQDEVARLHWELQNARDIIDCRDERIAIMTLDPECDRVRSKLEQKDQENFVLKSSLHECMDKAARLQAENKMLTGQIVR